MKKFKWDKDKVNLSAGILILVGLFFMMGFTPLPFALISGGEFQWGTHVESTVVAGETVGNVLPLSVTVHADEVYFNPACGSSCTQWWGALTGRLFVNNVSTGDSFSISYNSNWDCVGEDIFSSTAQEGGVARKHTDCSKTWDFDVTLTEASNNVEVRYQWGSNEVASGVYADVDIESTEMSGNEVSVDVDESVVTDTSAVTAQESAPEIPDQYADENSTAYDSSALATYFNDEVENPFTGKPVKNVSIIIGILLIIGGLFLKYSKG